MNQGIMHLSFDRRGGRTACNMRLAHQSTTVERFRAAEAQGWKQCKRCAAKLAGMDERQARRAALQRTGPTEAAAARRVGMID